MKVYIDKIMKSVFVSVLLEMLSGYKKMIIHELDKIAAIIQILIPVIISQFNIGFYEKIALACILLFCVSLIKRLHSKMTHKVGDGIPVPVKRITHVDGHGFAEIKEDDMQYALLYLVELENYLEEKGWLK